MKTPFKEFRDAMRHHINSMFVDGPYRAPCLFVVQAEKDFLWNLYLDSFPLGTNEIYRERREHDCSCCRQFVNAFGNVVALKDGKITTIWDFDAGSYQPIVDILAETIKALPIVDVFVTDQSAIGCDKNFETVDGVIQTWPHFQCDIPEGFVYRGRDTIGTVMSQYRSTKEVFKRSLMELDIEATNVVLELISQGSLYRGDEWKQPLDIFLGCQQEFASLMNSVAENLGSRDRDEDTQKLILNRYAWEKTVAIGSAIGRIRNHSIGVLLQDISGGMDLEAAVRRYEKIVAPTNYKRPKAIYTKKMVERAQQTVADLGLMDSLGRRHAKLTDISVNDILFINRDEAAKVSNVFERMGTDIPVEARKFDRAAEVSMEKFVSDILPAARSVEVLFDGRLQRNLMSLIAPKVPESKSMFKWNNGYSWAYNGNIADSMREQVAEAGGKIDGCLRFSIRWNDQREELDYNDEDAHCRVPNGTHIFFSKLRDYDTGGWLDVDVRWPVVGKPAIENISFPSRDKLVPGTYIFWVECYEARGGKSGFAAEIEFDGQIYQFEYRTPLRNQEKVVVAEVEYTKENGFKMLKSLDSTITSKDIWGVKTNTFVPVSAIMWSPNYWGHDLDCSQCEHFFVPGDGPYFCNAYQKQVYTSGKLGCEKFSLKGGVGNKHLFFLLKNCVNSDSPNGFYNEFLREDFMQHKHVFEALGSEMRVEPTDDQLSGLGFSTTQRNHILVRVKGAVDRVVKVVF